MTISTLLWGPAARVRAQLAALADAAAADIELLVATDGSGRHAAWQRAATEAAGDVLVVLGPLAQPTAALISTLADAVRAGAGLAAPAISSARTTAYGYAMTLDGALWPIIAPCEEPDVLALDCLAARPEVFATLPAWDVVAGHAEVQLATHARTFGPLVVPPGAEMRRLSDGPTLSIVVCTRNRVDEIAECIPACSALDLPGNEAELIVVDNGSTDGTGAVLEWFATRFGERVRIVHEPTLGLSRARNAGAGAATGDVLCFLDDDARPAPGWLEHLRLVFGDPEVAIAGGPACGLWSRGRVDGFPDASVAPYFSILDRGDAAHDSARPEDGPWGNNWSVRRSIVEELGGFDVRFGAGEGGSLGGEEVHLAWRVLQEGLGRLRYDPGVTVGHRAPADRMTEDYVVLRAFRCGVEEIRMRDALGQADPDSLMATASTAAHRLSRLALPGRRDTDATLGEIASAAVPLALRIDAAAALGQIVTVAALQHAESVAVGASVVAIRPEHARGKVRARAAVSGRQADEVLVCYPDVPVPSISAGHARAFELLRSLVRLGRQPVLFSLGSSGADETLELLAAEGIETHCADRGARLQDVAIRQFPVAIVSFWDIAERFLPLLRATPRTRIVVDSVDLHHRRMAREAELHGDARTRAEADAVRVRELAVYASADVVLAVSEDEQAVLCEQLPGTPVGLLPTIHHALTEPRAPFWRQGALFVGSYGHAPNVDAVRFLCGEVMPQLAALGVDVPIAVAGTGMPDDLAELARASGAAVLGFIPSVEEELELRRMSIAPLRFGAGLKGKVGESLAAGVPVVGTAIAAEGFAGAEDGMLVADDAPALARAIARLAGDDALWQRLSDGGRALVARTCGPERCDRELADVLGYLEPLRKAA